MVFSEVIKWFNVENATSFAPFSKSPIFGLNDDRKNHSSLAIVKKLDFTLLFTEYYLYINKLAPKIYLWMNLRLKSVGIMISKNPFLQL